MTLNSSAAQFPDPPVDEKPAPGTKKAVLAGGCFWCTEAVFEMLEGVRDVVSGYSGGTAETANYRRVSMGDTGHAEAIQITYDPSVITYGQLLRVFFEAAQALALRILREAPPQDRIGHAFLLALGRQPTGREREPSLTGVSPFRRRTAWPCSC